MNEKKKELHKTLIFRLATSCDIPKCFDIESKSYPEDEAATLSSLNYREKVANPYFLICEIENEIIGFICGTRCNTFTHETMSSHDPKGFMLAIHSVVVTESYRRKGIATCMLKEYIQRMNDTNLEELILIAKHNLLGFYIHCGFNVEKESVIVHGKDKWYDLRMTLLSKTQYFIVDSFSISNDNDYNGTGNPAAVVIMNESIDKTSRSWMQKIAAEFNLSETAFLWKQQNQMHYDIRYYTPEGVEIDLCGHATLASAFVILHQINQTNVIFCTKQNIKLPCTQTKDTSISMNFPWKNVIPLSSSLSTTTIQMLYDSLNVQNSDILYLGQGEDNEDLFVELTYNAFHNLPKTKDISYSHMISYQGPPRGIIVCCQNTIDKHDFDSRFFGPKAGINEDPVTGSAHCLLAPYFGKKCNKEYVIGKQRSKRGGIVHCILKPDENKVEIIGDTTLVMKGTLNV